MKILAVDDERLVRKGLTEELSILFPGAEIFTFEDGEDTITFVKELSAKQENISYAFLDIKLRGMTGIELAKEIKGMMPDVRIIFCTGYSEYAFEAYSMSAKGYLLKPVTARDIEKMLNAMDENWQGIKSKSTECLTVRTFGEFQVFFGEKPLVFQNEKAKELLAYLVDRAGEDVAGVEAAQALWPGQTYDRAMKARMLGVYQELRDVLKSIGKERLLIKSWNRITLDVSGIKCDVLDFIKGDITAINAYRGEYMSNYGWAVFTNRRL